jgi:glycosyltransferase involved in cell wall biosynthesis
MFFSALDWYFWLIAALGVIGTVRAIRSVFAMRLLPAKQPNSDTAPTVSIVVAARDEEARIEKTIRGLLAQTDVNLQVIVVDDRSTDRTGEILRHLATTNPRLTVIRIDHLPAGWLGKCHALHVGAAAASADWLLFVDGDIWLKPDTVARAVRQAIIDEVDHVTLMPGVREATFLGTAGQLLFNLGIARRAERVNRDQPNANLGIGAFNLVRTNVYRKFGGHEPLRMEVADDVKLSFLVKRAKGRTRVYFAPHDADADWCRNPRSFIRDLEKNHFAMAGYQISRVILGSAVIALFWFGALIGPFTGTMSGIAAGLGLAALIIPSLLAARRLRLSLVPALLVPYMIPIMGICLVNSATVTLRQGGVRWRDTFYPLAQLRAGLVQ